MKYFKEVESETEAGETCWFAAGVRQEQSGYYLLQGWSHGNKLSIFTFVTSVFELYIHLRYLNGDLAIAAIVNSKSMETGSDNLAGRRQYKEAHNWHLAFK